MTTAFIVNVESELKPDYEEMNNRLLEMLLNATTGSLPEHSATSVPRWAGPDPVVVQVQCILYLTLFATLMASYLAMVGKQWLGLYACRETDGSTTATGRVREEKLSQIEKWRFHLLGYLPMILQCAIFLLGFALSRYLWGVNRSVSSVVIGFTSLGPLLYLITEACSISSPDFPFYTPFTSIILFVIGLAAPYCRNLQRVFGLNRRPPQPGILGPQRDFDLLSADPVGAIAFGASITTLACAAPAVIQFPWSVSPVFSHRTTRSFGWGDSRDARCINRMFGMSADADVTASIMGFIPEVIWHKGIKDVPIRRIYNRLMDCFDFSGSSPVVISKLRDIAYLSARAYVHIELQRRCIIQHKQDDWQCPDEEEEPILPHTSYGSDPDLGTVLFMFNMVEGYDGGFPWEQVRMTPPHHSWMSHVFLYRAWDEGQVSEVVMDFVENSMSLRPPSDIVTTDCLFIIGLMLGVPLHVRDTTVQNKRFGLFSSRALFAKSPHLAARRIPSLGGSSKLFQLNSPLSLSKYHWPFVHSGS